jgi:hypothetical protein
MILVVVVLMRIPWSFSPHKQKADQSGRQDGGFPPIGYCGRNMKDCAVTTRIPVKTIRNNPDIPDMSQICVTKEKQ